METPQVSVVMPTFNRAHTLKHAIDSVLDQSTPTFELIIVDDGSTDETKAIVLSYADDRIRYIALPRNMGANVARNTGIKEAKASMIAFQDSDDTWHSRKLQLQLDLLDRHGKEVCFCKMVRHKGNQKTPIPKAGYGFTTGSNNWHADLLRGSFISNQTLMASKNILLKAGLFDESLDRLQDWDLCLRLAKLSDFCYLDDHLVDAFVGKDSVSINSKFRASLEYILAKYEADFRQDPCAMGIQMLNLAADSLNQKLYLDSLAYILRSVMCAHIYYPKVIAILGKRLLAS